MTQRLTPAELEVMRVLWDRGELKPAEIQRHFGREIKNPALRSILGILVDKGHVLRRKEGKAFFYKAKTRRHSVLRSTLREAADIFCKGSSESLLMHLIKSQKLSEEELIELKRLADQSDSSRNSK